MLFTWQCCSQVMTLTGLISGYCRACKHAHLLKHPQQNNHFYGNSFMKNLWSLVDIMKLVNMYLYITFHLFFAKCHSHFSVLAIFFSTDMLDDFSFI